VVVVEYKKEKIAKSRSQIHGYGDRRRSDGWVGRLSVVSRANRRRANANAAIDDDGDDDKEKRKQSTTRASKKGREETSNKDAVVVVVIPRYSTAHA
jgi:hypothetical protein